MGTTVSVLISNYKNDVTQHLDHMHSSFYPYKKSIKTFSHHFKYLTKGKMLAPSTWNKKTWKRCNAQFWPWGNASVEENEGRTDKQSGKRKVSLNRASLQLTAKRRRTDPFLS